MPNAWHVYNNTLSTLFGLLAVYKAIHNTYTFIYLCTRIKQHLGSGQFGVVSKGVWKYPRGKKEVAIKLLQAGAPENSCVQFLKEAAIMGQFSHRNVISLYGVVTLGEPVSEQSDF